MNTTNKKLWVTVGIFALIIVGAWFAFGDQSIDDISLKNSDMLKSDTDTALSIDADVEYFPGAKGYFVRPEADGNYPGVVMIHENRGLKT